MIRFFLNLRNLLTSSKHHIQFDFCNTSYHYSIKFHRFTITPFPCTWILTSPLHKNVHHSKNRNAIYYMIWIIPKQHYLLMINYNKIINLIANLILIDMHHDTPIPALSLLTNLRNPFSTCKPLYDSSAQVSVMNCREFLPHLESLKHYLQSIYTFSSLTHICVQFESVHVHVWSFCLVQFINEIYLNH